MKVFLVENLLNLVIYFRNVHSKNTEAPFPVDYHISTIIPNNARFHVMLKVPRTISFNCCMFQQYCTRMNKKKPFKPVTEIRKK